MLVPVIEGEETDHALFCKYAGELLERVTGKTLATSTVVPSVSRITRVFSIFSYSLQQETFIHYNLYLDTPFHIFVLSSVLQIWLPIRVRDSSGFIVSFHLIRLLKLLSK